MPSAKEALNDLLKGRELPSRLAARLNTAIDAGDVRVTRPLEAEEDIKTVMRPIIDDICPVWDEIMTGCSLQHAKQVSNQDRASITSISAINLTYGEVKESSLAMAIAKHVDMKGKKVFYDVGSGTGRGCFAAALIHDFDKIVGVELVPGLHDAAVVQKNLYDSKVKPRLDSEAKQYGLEPSSAEITLRCDDFRSFDWSDADLVWANSTCFGQELMEKLSQEAEKLKEGAVFITLTQRLNSPQWTQVGNGELMPMSWGGATIYVWKKNCGPVRESCADGKQQE